MEIKDKYKIGGHWLKVQTRSERFDNCESKGVSHHWDNLITIQEQMAQSKKEGTIFHEVIHEIDCQNRLKLTEEQVTSLGEGLYAFLIDNNLLK